MSTTGGVFYITAITSLERMDIQFVPAAIDISRSSKKADIIIVGKGQPTYHDVSGETVLDIVLDFHAEDDARRDVLTRCSWLQSLTARNRKGIREQIKVTFGRMFKDEIWTVDKVNCSYDNFSQQHGMLPQQAMVSVRFLLDTEDEVTQENLRWF